MELFLYFLIMFVVAIPLAWLKWRILLKIIKTKNI